MSDRNSILDTITDSLAPVHRDGHKFVAIGLVVTLLLFLIWPPLGWIAALVTLWIIYFFRDPDRVTPLRDGLVVAPADGRISAIESVRPPAELGLGDAERQRISIFLSVFDVHINRAPVAGRIVRSVYVPGAFLNAALDKASRRKRAARDRHRDGVGGDDRRRADRRPRRAPHRHVRRAKGESVGVGERFGLIRFGSRVDTYLPPGRNGARRGRPARRRRRDGARRPEIRARPSARRAAADHDIMLPTFNGRRRAVPWIPYYPSSRRRRAAGGGGACSPRAHPRAHAGAELLHPARPLRRSHRDPHVDRGPLRVRARRDRLRRPPRRHRRAHRPPAQGVLALRRRARQPRRLRQLRRRAGLHDLHLGPRRPEEHRLDLRARLRARLRAPPRPLQRRHRRRSAEVAVELLHRHADAGRRHRRAAADLSRSPGPRSARARRG